MSRLARHQRVLRDVADLLPHPIHALSIKALAPEEFTSLSPTTKDALR
jgi:stress-induced morphogen